MVQIKTVAASLSMPLVMGCASINWPHTRDADLFLAAPAGVVRFDGVVPVPFDTAYRNILRAAKQCWSRPAGMFLAPPVLAQGDVDTDRQQGLIEVSEIGGNLFAAVQLRGIGEGTLIRAAAIDAKGGLPGSTEIPLLPQWAAGQPTTCATIKPL